jgi:hypothetical protein
MWWILVGSVAVPALAAQMFLDAIVSRQYAEARKSWEADGGPRGFTWRAPEQGFFAGGTLARARVMNQWLFADPPWAGQIVKRLLRAYRIASLAQLAAMVGWVVALAVR